MTHDDLFKTLLPLMAFALLMSPSAGAAAAKPEPSDVGRRLRVYLGTYTRGKSEGIYVSELDLHSGKLADARLAAKAINPSFVAIHPSRRFVYAVGEINDFQGNKTGGVSAFAVDASTGQLTRINQQSSHGAGPCHLIVDAAGKNVLVANYGGGSVACLQIKEDGSLGSASAVIQHEGSSVNPRRQTGPHAHSINLDADNRFAVAADLGLDKVLIYRFESETGKLTPHEPSSVSVRPGGGPRHFTFHPGGRFAYANNEITSTLTAFAYDAGRGVLEEIHTVSTLPDDVHGDNSTAEVRVHPNGRFVYVSNRGHNSIAIFAVDRASGRLSPAGHEPTRGEIPRNFNLDPTGRYLLAANQNTHNVVVFRIDEKTGQLQATGSEIAVPSPVCVRFMQIDVDS